MKLYEYHYGTLREHGLLYCVAPDRDVAAVILSREYPELMPRFISGDNMREVQGGHMQIVTHQVKQGTQHADQR